MKGTGVAALGGSCTDIISSNTGLRISGGGDHDRHSQLHERDRPTRRHLWQQLPLHRRRASRSTAYNGPPARTRPMTLRFARHAHRLACNNLVGRALAQRQDAERRSPRRKARPTTVSNIEELLSMGSSLSESRASAFPRFLGSKGLPGTPSPAGSRRQPKCVVDSTT